MRAFARDTFPDLAEPGHDYVLIARSAPTIQPLMTRFASISEGIRTDSKR
ncbi:UNVERIFIED_CONTAM: hypothetical protein GTU68_012072 [Idotea baltica]|nr:hypothetical protein [Idotea baltica]